MHIETNDELVDGQAVHVAFRIGSTTDVGYIIVRRGVYGQDSLRRYGIDITGGKLKALYHKGTQQIDTDLLTYSANTWYEGIIGFSTDGQFRVVVWERDHPENLAYYVENLSSEDWSMHDWVFKVAAYNGTIDVDSYQETDDGAMGQRDFMSDASGNTEWTFDTRGRVIIETKTISNTGTFVTGWRYNAANLPTGMTYPGGNSGQSGETLTYSYNNQMALDRVFSQDYSYYYLQATQYDPAGRVTKRNMGATSLGNNPLLVSNFQFNDWDQDGGRLQFIHTGTYTNTTSLLNLVYAYDQVGNVDSVQDYTTGNPQTQSYAYDDLNRLTDASASGGYAGHGNYSESYAYDASTGNLASKAGAGYTYNAQVSCDAGNRTIPHAVSAVGSNAYTYDCNGNMTQRNLNGSVTNLSYDAENRLVSASGAASATFIYDGDGKRVASVISGTTTVFIGNYYEWTSTTTKKYYYAGSTRLAERAGSAFIYMFGDHLGSTSRSYRVDNGGVSTLLYTGWGESRYYNGNLPSQYHYTGQYDESSLGLYYYGARWYDPSLSRWVQPDSIIPEITQGTQAWDRFAYVNNNPVKTNDPTGHYGPNVHYYLTYQVVYEIAITLADESGFSPDGAREFADRIASEVSNGDMAADAQAVENGEVKMDWRYWRDNNPIRPPGTEAPDVSIAPHWYTTDQAQEALQEAENPFEFGIALHKYQDSFSHWQKLGQPDTPGGIYDGHCKNQVTYRLGDDENIDNYSPTHGKYKDKDRTMYEGMTEGFAYEQITYLVQFQLDKMDSLN